MRRETSLATVLGGAVPLVPRWAATTADEQSPDLWMRAVFLEPTNGELDAQLSELALLRGDVKAVRDFLETLSEQIQNRGRTC